MSVGGKTTQQLNQELQNELTTANQLLRQISIELQKIKSLSRPGGEFELNVKQNASLLVKLASILKVDLDKVVPITRVQLMETTQNTNLDMSYE